MADKKKRFFLKHKKSSALLVTIAIHAVFAVVAISFVVVSALKQEYAVFEAVEAPPRPKPQLKKLEIPVKDNRKQAPKIRQMVVSKPNASVSLQMPEMVGVVGGAGFGKGTGLGGLSVGFNWDPFGGDGAQGAGDEFVGQFYDLKQTSDHELTRIGELAAENTFNAEAQTACMEVLNKFIRSGMRKSGLEEYFVAPKLKYATAFNMPPMSAGEAPKAYGVEDQVKPSYWVCVYRGQIAAPEDGKYRFWGLADDVLVVRVKGRLVLDGCWPEHIGRISDWQSDDEDSRRFQVNRSDYGEIKGMKWMDAFPTIQRGLKDGSGFSSMLRQVKGENGQTLAQSSYMSASNRLVIGDWIDLKKGQRVDMEVLIGEIPGGFFGCRLLVEQRGKTYQQVESDAGLRPVLPVFKTRVIPDSAFAQMKAESAEMTLEGPSFGAMNASPVRRR